MPLFRRVRPGEPVRALTVNELIDAARRGRLRAGSGIVLREGSGGTTIAATLAAGNAIPSRITRVYGVDAAGEGRVESVFYDAVPIGRGPEAAVERVAPVYGRQFARGPRIVAARVGHLCWIVRAPTDEGGRTGDLWVETEQLIGRACEAPPPGGIMGRIARMLGGGVGPGPAGPPGSPASPGDFPAPPAEP